MLFRSGNRWRQSSALVTAKPGSRCLASLGTSDWPLWRSTVDRIGSGWPGRQSVPFTASRSGLGAELHTTVPLEYNNSATVLANRTIAVVRIIMAMGLTAVITRNASIDVQHRAIRSASLGMICRHIDIPYLTSRPQVLSTILAVGPLVLTDVMPFSMAAAPEYISLLPMTWPLPAFRLK